MSTAAIKTQSLKTFVGLLYYYNGFIKFFYLVNDLADIHFALTYAFLSLVLYVTNIRKT